MNLLVGLSGLVEYTALPGISAILLIILCGSSTRADGADCNGNGIPDSEDLARSFRMKGPMALPPLSEFLSTDINGDGRSDLVGLTYQVGSFKVFLQRDLGMHFEEKTLEVAGGEAVAVGDLDGDLKPDLIISGRPPPGTPAEGGITPVLQDQSGSFKPGATLALANPPTRAVPADLDGDGDLDIAVLLYASNGISLIENRGSGRLKVVGKLGGHSELFALAVADLNGDGRPDLATGGGTADEVISLYVADEAFSFAQPVLLPSPAAPRHIYAADLDGDQATDLCVLGGNPPAIAVLWNQPGGDLRLSQVLARKHTAHSGELADFDGDELLDLAVAQGDAPVVVLRLNDRAEQLTEILSLRTDGDPVRIAAGDWDADGNVDLAVGTSQHTSIYLSEAPGVIRAAQSIPGFRVRGIALGDLDGEGDLDVAALSGDGVNMYRHPQGWRVPIRAPAQSRSGS